MTCLGRTDYDIGETEEADFSRSVDARDGPKKSAEYRLIQPISRDGAVIWLKTNKSPGTMKQDVSLACWHCRRVTPSKQVSRRCDGQFIVLCCSNKLPKQFKREFRTPNKFFRPLRLNRSDIVNRCLIHTISLLTNSPTATGS